MTEPSDNLTQIAEPQLQETPVETVEAARSAETVEAVEQAAPMDPTLLQPGQTVPGVEPGVTVTRNEDNPNTVTITTRKRVRKRSKSTDGDGTKLSKGKKALVIAIIVVAVLALVALIAPKALANAGKSHLLKGSESEAAQTAQDAGALEYGGVQYQKNPDMVTVLLLGVDDESNAASYPTVTRHDAQCSDANLLVAMDTVTNEVNVISIPRDAEVDIDLYENGQYTVTKPLQLCLAYSVDLPTKNACAQNSAKSVSRIFKGTGVGYYVSVDQAVLRNIADYLGGVRLTAMETIPGTPIVKGQEVLLQGESAYRYVSWRDSSKDYTAQDRLARQKQFVGAALKQLRGADLATLKKLYSSIEPDIETNLGLSEFTYLATCFTDGQTPEIKTRTLEGEVKMLADDDGVKREHVYLDEDSVMKTIVDVFYRPVSNPAATDPAVTVDSPSPKDKE